MLNKVKTIAEIFNEVKCYDLVITNDAPLATALNKLVEEPRLDYLAMTPKQIASKFAQLYYDKIYEKYEVVLNISKRTGKSFKIVHHTLEKIYEIWMYNAKLEFAEHFLSEEEFQFVKYLGDYNTIETAMENFNENFYGNKKIALVGEELFSLLDLEVIPRRGSPAAEIEVFKDGGFKIDQTYIFPTSAMLIDNVLELINDSNADETAIVLDPDSKYLEIMKARLKESGLKIEIKNYLSEESSVRSFISLVELSFRIEELKVSEYIPIASEFGIEINSKYANYDLTNFIRHINKDKYLTKLFEVCRKIPSYKYTELIVELRKNFDFKITKEFNGALQLIELHEKSISEENLIELKYFLKEFDIEVGVQRSGVLFVNAVSSAFVDRQIIFYVGLDNSWMKLFPDKDYLNKKDEEKKNLKRFQILIQQGSKRFYFVTDAADNIEIPPCYYFLMLGENDAGSFNSKYFNPVCVDNKSLAKAYTKIIKKLPTEEKTINSISPSGFNNYFKCPKYYSLNKFIRNEDNPAFRKGNLLHEFAELYFHHPEFARDNFQKILGMMVEDLSLFHQNSNKDFMKTEFQIGMESIISFLDKRNLHKIPLEKPESPEGNDLMGELKLEKIYRNTEQRLSDSEDSGISGKIDLQSGNTIVDYKSSKYRRSDINKAMQSNLGYIMLNESEEFDFQAIAYITSLRRSFNEINFIYYYLFNNFRNQINPNEFETKNEVELKYLPMTFLEYLSTIEVFEKMKSKDQPAKFLNKIGYEYYKQFLNKLNLKKSEYFIEEILSDRVIEEANNLLSDLQLSNKSIGAQTQDSLNKNYIKPIAKIIFSIRTGNWSPCIIFKDDADEFSQLINDKLYELNKYENSTYEYSPVFGSREICKSCDFLNICIGNKLWH